MLYFILCRMCVCHMFNKVLTYLLTKWQEQNIEAFWHWLRARERITFKLCLLVYKALNGMAPSYIQDLCVPVSSVSTRVALRSAARGDLAVPRTRLPLGNRAFSVAGPAVWNSLPTDIRSAPTLCTFKNRLKTICFYRVFCTLSFINLIRVAYVVRRPCIVTLRTCFGAM